MSTSQEIRRRKAAVFIDAENHDDLSVSTLMNTLDRYDVVEQHAYADWRTRRLARLAWQLKRFGFEMHHAFSGRSPGAEKDEADGCMARGITRVLGLRHDVAVVVIVTGDAFFTQVVHQLQRSGKRVTVVANPFRTSRELYAVADEYFPIGRWGRALSDLDQLERDHRYLTFSFVTGHSKIGSSVLGEMIRQNLVIQQNVHRPERGIRPELRLNRKAPIVEMVLDVGRGRSTSSSLLQAA